MIFGTFNDAIKNIIRRLIDQGSEIHPNNWQSMNVSQLKAAAMKELLAVNFQVVMPQSLDGLRNDIKPNLPWTDLHFETERISREPVNPGETWKQWPWANSAATFRNENKQFDHSYAERYWPRHSGQTPDGHLSELMKSDNRGIRDRLGDLDDIVNRLLMDPTTRQAVLTVWFPEDQAPHGRRVPCSLSYQFIVRGNRLHILYAIRSCDALRHFRDDLYLSCRLAHWILLQLRSKDESWDNCLLGLFTITIGSFHCFVNDLPTLEKQLCTRSFNQSS